MNRTLLALLAIVIVSCDGGNDLRMVGLTESDRIELAADYAEPIIERPFAEGTRVGAGDIVVRQDASRLAARLSEAEATLAQQDARLRELTRGPRQEQIEAAQADLEGAKKDLEFRRIEYQRAELLLERQLGSPEDRDKARAALDSASAAVDFRHAQLDELLSGTTVEELDQARAAVRQAEAIIDQLKVEIDRVVLEAPVDAMLDSLLFEPGETPQAGQPVAVLLGGEQPYARIYVPEALRVNIRSGDPVRVFIDGLDAPIDGRIRWIATEAAFTPYFALTEHDRGRLTYAAKVDLDFRGERLPDGVPVEAELIGEDSQ